MRKTPFILLFTTLCLVSLPFAYGSYPDTINKGLVCYGIDLNYAQIDFISSNFDLVDMNFGYENDAVALHDLNSDIIVLGYRDLVYARESPIIPDWTTILANPDWFLKDGSGDFIYAAYWGAYVMNISNVDYQQHVIDWLETQFGSGYDGVFCDDAWMHLDWYTAGFNTTVTVDTTNNWNTWMEEFVEHLQADLTELVIVNSDEMETDVLLNDADGQMMEYFIHHDADSNVWDSDYEELGADLARKGALDKIIFCLSFYDEVDTESDNNCIQRCYDGFVGNSTNLEDDYWGMNTFSYDSNGYYEIMDTPYEPEYGEEEYQTPPSYSETSVLPPKVIVLAVMAVLFGLIYVIYKDVVG